MRHLLVPALVLAGMSAGPLTAHAQDAQEIMAEVERRRAERYADVQDFLKVQIVAGLKAATFHEKTGSGFFRMVPFDEIHERQAAAQGQEPVRMTEDMARAYEMLGDALRQGMKEEGFPADGPLDPRNMTDPMAAFIRAGANAEPLPDGRAEAAEEAAGWAEFARRADFVAREEVDGRDSFHLRVNDLSDIEVAPSGDGEFELVAASLWIDPVEYVPLKMVIEARGRSGGDDWFPMTIEKVDLDYRLVGPLYESHQQVLRIGGMEEAMAEQMREMQAQLEQLPPAQRRMIENQMKNAMNQFEAVVFVDAIFLNEGLPTPERMAALIRPAGE
jgi:hypothetical protein